MLLLSKIHALIACTLQARVLPRIKEPASPIANLWGSTKKSMKCMAGEVTAEASRGLKQSKVFGRSRIIDRL